MKFYIYEADVYCEDCAHAIGMVCHSHDFATGSTCDSSCTPIEATGGETDTPDHCGGCGLFLERALTDDGVQYVAMALMDDDGDADVLDTWRAFYSDQLERLPAFA
jgi:hypothetical protein